LGEVARRIGQDWALKYRHDLEWWESFVERSRFAGRCYRAANWQWVIEKMAPTRRCARAIKLQESSCAKRREKIY
jgi:hypothetical protein